MVPDMEEILRVTQDTEDIKFLLDHVGLPMKGKLGECTLVLEDNIWKISKVSNVS